MKKACVAVACALLGSAANAADRGAYAGVGVGQLQLDQTVGTLKFSASDTAYKVFGGYAFSRYFRAEAGYINGGTPSEVISGVTFDIKSDAIQVAGIGTIPIGSRFGLFIKAGLLSWESTTRAVAGSTFATSDDDGVDFIYGIGASLSIHPKFELRAEFEASTLEDTDVKLLTVSGVFHF